MSVEKVTGEPEITTAMLHAGVQIIAEEWGICGEDLAPGLATAVFKAMWAARNHDPEPNSSNS